MEMIKNRFNRRRSGSPKPAVLVSHQGCIPIYRKAFFERLNKEAAIDFVVVHGNPLARSDLIPASPPFDFPNVPITNAEWSLGSTKFVWQPVLWRVVRGDFHAAVIGDEVKFLSNIAAALVLFAYGRPVFLWGFGFHQYDRAPEGLLARMIAAVAAEAKRLLYRKASGYLAYTEGGAKALRTLPHPPPRIAVLQNTVDTAREAEFRAIAGSEPLDAACRELGVRTDSTKLLYFGRFVPAKNVDLLIQYARRCSQSGRNVDIVLFGAGSQEEQLKSSAHGLGNVVFHRHDDLNLARALRVSIATVIPGYVGLAVTHSFAHGVPVITRLNQMHSPEVEYLAHDVNGLMLPDDPQQFFSELDRFLEDHALQDKLRSGAEATARTIDMSAMATTFRQLIAETLQAKGQL
jgi:glycosyltransferase involved in cell wall biosynthesis